MLAPVLALTLAAAPRIAVMPITPGAAVSPPEAAAMTEALVSEVRRRSGAEVITQAEITSILTMEQQKRMLGCGTDACMAELGGALGVGRLVTGNVAKLGESLLVHLRLVDTVKVRVVAQSDRRLKRGSYDDLLDALPVMVAELMEESPAAPAPAPKPAPASSPPKPAAAPPAPGPPPSGAQAAAAFRPPEGTIAIHARSPKDLGLIAWSDEPRADGKVERRYVTPVGWYQDPSGSTDFGLYWLLPASQFKTGRVGFGFIRPSRIDWGDQPWVKIGRAACGAAEWPLADSRQIWIDPKCKLHAKLDEALRVGQ